MNNQPADVRGSSFPVGVFYPIAAALIILPIIDSLLGIFPLKPHALEWRIANIGFLSGALTIPLIGFVMASVAAHLLGHGKTQRAFAVLYFLLGFILLLTLILFAFDFMQYRPHVQKELLRTYDAVGVKAVIAQTILSVVFLVFGVTILRHSRAAARRAERLRQSPVAPVFTTAKS